MSKPIDVRNQAQYDVDQFSIGHFHESVLEGILLPNGIIKDRVTKLAKEVARKHSYHNLLALCVMDGAQQFHSDLVKAMYPLMNRDLEPASVKGTSYNGTETLGYVEFNGFDFERAEGKNILIVEDIIDTGLTLTALTKKMKKYNPKSIEIACLLDKKERRDPKVTLKPDYTGFIIPDHFVVGYGLDFNSKYRLLPHISVLKQDSE